MSQNLRDFEDEDASCKKLYVLRHGKSDWEANFSSDHERPLANRGQDAASKMGKHLASIKQVPELVLCSTSVRTKQTLSLAREHGGWKSEVQYYRELYLASVTEALQLVKKQSDTVDKLMLVAHEPMCSSIIAELAKGSNVKFPTASVARISLRVNRWSEVQANTGYLDWLLTPKALFR